MVVRDLPDKKMIIISVVAAPKGFRSKEQVKVLA
jgi:hypothetical protein